MKREKELDLLSELAGLREAGSAFLDETVTRSPVDRYLDPDRFEAERRDLFRALPTIAAHSGELAEPDSFLRRQLAGLPVLLTRDSDGRAHAFLNVCRHRGARLVDDPSGCRKRFTCPYHAWTWDNRGALRAIPHREQGFPGLDESELGLRRLPCEERHGWIWIVADPGREMDLDAHLGEIGADLDWLGMTGCRVAHAQEIDCRANWKVLIEGGLEAYHFRVAHRNTIAPYFPDNLSSYETFGPHMRSVLPREGLERHVARAPADWSIREAANIIYSLFPTNQLLVQSDHVAWVQLEPVAADRTLIRLSTVVPGGPEDATAERAAHWRQNHAITSRTLSEDFAIGESVQSGFATGANAMLNFGRFEGALDRFNLIVEGYLAIG